MEVKLWWQGSSWIQGSCLLEGWGGGYIRLTSTYSASLLGGGMPLQDSPILKIIKNPTEIHVQFLVKISKWVSLFFLLFKRPGEPYRGICEASLSLTPHTPLPTWKLALAERNKINLVDCFAAMAPSLQCSQLPTFLFYFYLGSTYVKWLPERKNMCFLFVSV